MSGIMPAKMQVKQQQVLLTRFTYKYTIHKYISITLSSTIMNRLGLRLSNWSTKTRQQTIEQMETVLNNTQ